MNILKKYFKENVVEPIKNHVKAKRYLARNQKYYEILSPASITSLHFQGGVMNDEEAKEDGQLSGDKVMDDAGKTLSVDADLQKVTQIQTQVPDGGFDF